MKNFNQNLGEMDNSEFYKDVAKHKEASFDGEQNNGRDGSPMRNKFSIGNIAGVGMGEDESGQMKSDAAPNYNGMNFNNLQHRLNNTAHDNSPDMKWEKGNGVFHDPAGTFKDWDASDGKEYDLKPIIKVCGMPKPNVNHNTSTDCYGGY